MIVVRKRGFKVIKQSIKKAVALVLLIFISLMGFSYSTLAGQFKCPPNYLRVALASNAESAEFAVAEGDYELIDYITHSVIDSNAVGGSWVVAPAGSTNIQVSNQGKGVQGLHSSLMVLRPKNDNDSIFRFKNKRYRGELLIENLNGKIQIINVVDIEQYLYGVVGAEIGAGAADEALKAQAIVSRTYALYYKNHPQLNYDVGITTKWQVYGGYDKEILSGARVKNAVDDTKSLVICYDDQLIQAFFHSNSGGYTESCENVWFENIPYIRPVAAPEDSYALQVEQNSGWPAVTYEWQVTYSKQELLSKFGDWNSKHPDDYINVGDIKELAASRYSVNPVTREYDSYETKSKRVTKLDIIGTSGIKSFFKDKIRSVFGLRSTLFIISHDSTIKLWNAMGTTDTYNNTNDLLAITVDGMVANLNGNNKGYYVVGADGVAKTLPKEFSTVIIDGKGFGHGLGMSQWGARGMAAGGTDYRTIIEHYFNQGRNDGRLQIKPYLIN